MTRLVVDETEKADLTARYVGVREQTEALAAPLSPEDQTVQSMPDVSPTKWHRAHTTWFFETFLLETSLPGYEPYDADYAYLFNSYYESLGARHPRPSRGLLSRPTVDEIAAYRRSVDEAMLTLLSHDHDGALDAMMELGLNHEQQHQELLLMDTKHVLSQNVPQPAYRQSAVHGSSSAPATAIPPAPAARLTHDGGICEVGHPGGEFAFDNEMPRHPVLLQPFEIDARPVNCAEWIEFIEDDGYATAEHWLSDGWAAVNSNGWEAPLYWYREDGEWWYFTLSGPRAVCGAEPVCHVSYYEADAFAHWAGARLPLESEWEVVAAQEPAVVSPLDARQQASVESPALHPRPVSDTASSFYGDVWQWTASSYSPYPGFEPASGAVGEYNGKFMVNQQVLRGGCCATPADHVRATYRNFFPPSARWAFSGVRLAHG